MGIRFDLSVVNWLAYLIQPGADVPPNLATLASEGKEYEALGIFLNKLEMGFRSSKEREREIGKKVKKARECLLEYKSRREDRGITKYVLAPLREDLGGRAWTALIIPSWTDRRLDDFLNSEFFLQKLVGHMAHKGNESNFDPGLILQLQRPEGQQDMFALLDVFPALHVALNNISRWPGLLAWNNQGDSAFFPIHPGEEEQIEGDALAIVKALNQNSGKLREIYREFMATRPQSSHSSNVLTILQLSDLHLGSKEAHSRITQVHQWVRELCHEHQDLSSILPVVTGDLMNSNSDRCRHAARLFIDFLSNLGTLQPVFILGNHDVKRHGVWGHDFRPVIQLSCAPSEVYWYDDCRVGLVCFNSVIAGSLARGFISEDQRIDLGMKIRGKTNWRDYTLVAALHHHPVKIANPPWYIKESYEKLFGGWFGKTDELKDADQFMNFVENLGMAAVIHGHKHIPKISENPNRIPIFGCGSSVGKVKRKGGRDFLSSNLITIDTRKKFLAGRILAQAVGGGPDKIEEHREHQLVYLPQTGFN